MSDDHRQGAASPGGPAPRTPAPPGTGGSTWTGEATGHHQWLLAVLGAGCLALGILLAVDSAWNDSAPLWMSVTGCVAGGLLALFGTLAFVKVHVRVDSECLEVRCGHMGLPRHRIHLRDVVEAEFVPRVTPRHWGGWGYRWRPEKGTAVVVRRGEGMLLRMGDGRTFTVTVDNAEAAVRAVRERLQPPGHRPA
ncbi:hypothetical protein [Streptomyces sp. HNM0574]|uniref:hypothetical protein n=1 Tax=Streptomyces sp. HNM0574 TaxID=2714954 RepID=UPI00146B9F86|nr:hypothetical protein [Streptomyces sp. HNM0574]NLU68233.1 hypothetical protein [Streptomyces sp. HNM0574]